MKYFFTFKSDSIMYIDSKSLSSDPKNPTLLSLSF